MPLDWHEVSVDYEGVRLTAQYVADSRIMVRTTAPFAAIRLVHMDELPTEEELPGVLEEILVRIHRTCLWVQEHQEELRARYRPVLEAAENSDEYMSTDRYRLVRDRLENDPSLSDEERHQLLDPIEDRWFAWQELRAATMNRARKELGCDWSHAFWVVDPLAPHFDPTRATDWGRDERE